MIPKSNKLFYNDEKGFWIPFLPLLYKRRRTLKLYLLRHAHGRQNFYGRLIECKQWLHLVRGLTFNSEKLKSLVQRGFRYYGRTNIIVNFRLRLFVTHTQLIVLDTIKYTPPSTQFRPRAWFLHYQAPRSRCRQPDLHSYIGIRNRLKSLISHWHL